jgi:hypothetical protein
MHSGESAGAQALEQTLEVQRAGLPMYLLLNLRIYCLGIGLEPGKQRFEIGGAEPVLPIMRKRIFLDRSRLAALFEPSLPAQDSNLPA